MAKLTFFGHASFRLEKDNQTFLFDPFLSNNPLAPVKASEVQADYIFVTHAHFDHLGDTYEIAGRTGATVISTAEIVNECAKHELKCHAMHIGGKFRFDFGYVRVTPAFHGSGIPGGHACGFIVNFHGLTVYHTGDTSLFGDMKLLGELEKINIALLPIGGNFTMDLDDAVYAAKLLGADTVIPFHYNTWPLIEADPREFKTKVEKETTSQCVILTPGESAEV